MARPALRIVKQPPVSVLVGTVFEIEVQASVDGNTHQLKVDDRIDIAETPTLVDCDVPATLRCSCSKPISNLAIIVRLVCSNGKIIATVETTPISVTFHKINVRTTKEWTSPWYKDEGGREKSIDLVASLTGGDKGSGSLKFCLKPVLYYASGKKGLVVVANQDILRILSDDLSIKFDESRLIRFRVEDVSKNHQGQDFQIQLSVENRPDILPGISPKITVRSKRNKRTRVSSNTSKQPAMTTKPESRPIIASHIQKAIYCVMQWSSAAASALQSMPAGPNVARCLSEYDYIQEQLCFLQNASFQESVKFQNTGNSAVVSQKRLPLHRGPEAVVPTSHPSILNQAMVLNGLEHMPEETLPPRKSRRRVESGNVVRNKNRLVVADLVSTPAKEEDAPAFSIQDAVLGIGGQSCSLDEARRDKVEAKSSKLLRDSEQSDVFHREKGTDPAACITWRRTTMKVDSENSDGLDSGRIKFEKRIEYLLGAIMKSKQSDEYLGFPVFCAEKKLLGFLREHSFGEYGFVPPPASFSLSDREEAAKILSKYPVEAIFSKTKLLTQDALIHHALVHIWKIQSEVS